jgi:hypothetical protein
MSSPTPRPVVVDVLPPRRREDARRSTRRTSPVPPVGSANRRVDRAVVANPAILSLPRKERDRATWLVEYLKQRRVSCAARPTHEAIGKYAALAWALEVAGVILPNDGGER